MYATTTEKGEVIRKGLVENLTFLTLLLLVYFRIEVTNSLFEFKGY